MNSYTIGTSELSTGNHSVISPKPLPQELLPWYRAIIMLSSKHGYCFAKADYFTRFFAVKRWAVYSNLKKLSDHGYIRCVDVEGSHERRIYPLVKLKTATTDKAKKPGFVYLMESGGYCKIGQSVNPSKRAEGIQTGSAHAVVVVHVIETNDMDPSERYWQRQFASRRVQGEWFHLSDFDILEFKRVNEMDGKEIVR